MVKIFLDTNIVLDFLEKSRTRHIVSSTIVKECLVGNIIGCISETVITNCSYLLRKSYTQIQQNDIYLNFSKHLQILALTNKTLKIACTVNIHDLEDAILYQIALESDCAYFITSNLSDFVSIAKPQLKAISPEDFLKWYESSSA